MVSKFAATKWRVICLKLKTTVNDDFVVQTFTSGGACKREILHMRTSDPISLAKFHFSANLTRTLRDAHCPPVNIKHEVDIIVSKIKSHDFDSEPQTKMEKFEVKN